MNPNQTRARVFVSCGQSKGTDEAQIASQIAERLRQVGFDPYIAVTEQSLRGLRENIFEQLRRSEYFIFVDFKRERLVGAAPPIHRGSLFSHQELAIASFLEIEVLAFQEQGVKRDDGLIRFLQANAIPFTDRHTLPNVVADMVQQRRWDPSWRNELVLERQPQQFEDAHRIGEPEPNLARYFHVDVRNRHRDKMATNCYVYLERAVLLPDTNIPLRTVEFTWAGTVLPNVGIAPGSVRPFDALFIRHHAPTAVEFNVFTTSTAFYPRIAGQGEYTFSYLVTADNFPPARASFTLRLNQLLGQTTFT